MPIRRLIGLLLLASCLQFQVPATTHAQIDPAQQYKQVQPAAWINDRTEFGRMRIDVFNLLRGNMDFNANKAKLDKYFQTYIFPQMTLTATEELNQLPQRRQDFLSMLQRQAPSKQAHDYVVGLTMRTMEAIALGDFHPAVRYNAMLIIGEMNAAEAQLSGSNGTPPLPLSTALPILLRELDNADQLQAVRVAALIGIHRHARMEGENAKINRSQFQDADLRQLIDRMLELVKAEQPPEGRSVEGHNWMRRRAIEVLAELGKVDSGGSVASQLESIVANEQAPLQLRLTAARAIGKLSFTTVQNFNAAALATEVGALALQSVQEEQQRVTDRKAEEAERELRLKLAQQDSSGFGRSGGSAGEGRGGSFEGGGTFPGQPFGGFGSDTELLQPAPDWQMLVSKRRLRHQLGSARLALAGSAARGDTSSTTGLLARATGPQQAQVKKLVDAVDLLIAAVEAQSLTQEALLQRVTANLPTLEALVTQNSGSAPAAGPGAAAPGAPAGPGSPPPGGPEGPGGPGSPSIGGPGGPAPGPGDFGPGAPVQEVPLGPG